MLFVQRVFPVAVGRLAQRFAGIAPDTMGRPHLAADVPGVHLVHHISKWGKLIFAVIAVYAVIHRNETDIVFREEGVAILTKSFGEFIGLKNSAYVDINNCPFAPQLLNRGFAKDTGLYKESGFCSYPLWTFDETVLKETGGEKYERYARAYDEYMESSFIGMMGAEDETGEEICTGMMM